MGKKAPAAPPPPDPAATAAAQGAANLDTAIAQQYLNMVNQSGPFGSVTYTPTGESLNIGGKNVQRYAQNVTLDPAQQRQLNLNNQIQEQALGLGQRMLGTVGEVTAQPFDLSSLPKAPGSGDFTADRQNVVNALIGRVQPQLDRDRARMENQLANQGIARGTEAYNAAIDDLSRGQNDLRLAAEAQGGSEQSRLFGLADSARKSAFQEQAFQRSLPTNELATLLGFGGNVQGPQFSSAPQTGVGSTDVMGAYNTQYQGQLNNYNQQMNARNAQAGGLYGLAGAGLSAFFSDIRLKHAVRWVGNKDGINVYEFEYLGKKGRYRGVMAQEVEHLPFTTVNIDGMLAVNYAALPVPFECVR
jgi:hypothetical protein